MFLFSVYRTKKLVKKFGIPAQFPNGVAFGGTKLDHLYVTTSSVAFNVFTATSTKDGTTPNDGKIYMIKNLSAKGYCGREARFQKT